MLSQQLGVLCTSAEWGSRLLRTINAVTLYTDVAALADLPTRIAVIIAISDARTDTIGNWLRFYAEAFPITCGLERASCENRL